MLGVGSHSRSATWRGHCRRLHVGGRRRDNWSRIDAGSRAITRWLSGCISWYGRIWLQKKKKKKKSVSEEQRRCNARRRFQQITTERRRCHMQPDTDGIIEADKKYVIKKVMNIRIRFRNT
ncbi:hypothetical protein M758_UG080500 [Ceratodon purpureus]|nr:hypothetical protein M758_UG080500 [Ceratodon purpureus]